MSYLSWPLTLTKPLFSRVFWGSVNVNTVCGHQIGDSQPHRIADRIDRAAGVTPDQRPPIVALGH